MKQFQLAIFARQYTAPVLKRYTPLKTPVSLWWFKKVSPIAKYSGAVLSTALALTHVHPNVLGTVVPPVLLATYYAGTKAEKLSYKKSLQLLQGGTEVTWRINTYDETSIENVKQGIESEYDDFKKQIQKKLESQMIEFFVELEKNGVSPWTKDVIDENKQIVFHLGDPETFVNSKAESEDFEEAVQFISFSIPYHAKKKRLGVAQVSMLEREKGEGFVDYGVAVQLWTYEFLPKPKRIC